MNCELHPDSPHISQGHLKKTGTQHVNGKVRYRCQMPVQAHHLKAYLEHATGGDWVVKASGATDRLPHPGGQRTTFQVVYPGCISGTWRMAVKATVTFRGKTFGTPLRHSGPREITC